MNSSNRIRSNKILYLIWNYLWTLFNALFIQYKHQPRIYLLYNFQKILKLFFFGIPNKNLNIRGETANIISIHHKPNYFSSLYEINQYLSIWNRRKKMFEENPIPKHQYSKIYACAGKKKSYLNNDIICPQSIHRCVACTYII